MIKTKRLTAENIRKSIYNLALNGKLSIQKNDDSPIDFLECKTIEVPLPKNWICVQSENLIDIVTGTSYDKNDVCNDGLRILRGGNIKNNEINLQDSDVFLPKNKYFDSNKVIKKNDIVIVGSTGSKEIIGNPAFAKKDYFDTSIGAFLRILRPKQKEFQKWLQVFYKSEIYREQIRKQAAGTCINNVGKKMLTSMLIPLPPLEEQKRIVDKLNKLEPLLKQYEETENKLSNLEDNIEEQLKKSILQHAISGELIKKTTKFNTKKLGQLVEIKTGKRDANFGSLIGKYNFFTCALIPIKCNSYSYDGEYILLPGNGANVGKSILYSGKFEAYQRTYLIKPKNDELNIKYLKIVLDANWLKWNQDKMFGSAIPYIKLANIYDFPVPLPSINEQRRIVEKVKKINEEMNSLCQS